MLTAVLTKHFAATRPIELAGTPIVLECSIGADNSSELGKYHELIKTSLLTYGLLV
jgi:hypothetical protein